MSKITAPFSERQVRALNDWQKWGSAHPFTCPAHSDEPLAAETDGWRCRRDGCGYTQDWAHEFMAMARYCTAEHPWPPGSDPSEYWIHVDAVETMPEWEGEVIPYHCPNCGLDFDVDYR